MHTSYITQLRRVIFWFIVGHWLSYHYYVPTFFIVMVISSIQNILKTSYVSIVVLCYLSFLNKFTRSHIWYLMLHLIQKVVVYIFTWFITQRCKVELCDSLLFIDIFIASRFWHWFHHGYIQHSASNENNLFYHSIFVAFHHVKIIHK